MFAKPKPVLGGRGVTLVELAVTLSVLTILSLIAAPTFSDQIQRARIRAAAEALTDLFVLSRSEAIKRGSEVSVTTAGTPRSWCAGASDAGAKEPGDMAGSAAACDCSDAADCVVGDERLVVDGTDFRDVTLANIGGTVTFDGKHGTLSTLVPTTFQLAVADRYRLRVAVGATGVSSTCVPVDDAPISGIPPCP